MRYPPEHKAAARARLIEAGGALAKKSGFSNTGMDALAAAAGVTTGAVYSQFRSKSDLLYAIVDHELLRTQAMFSGKTLDQLKQVLVGYLSLGHVTRPDKGCPMPALGAEIARADDVVRHHFESLMGEIVTTLEAALGDREKAWTLLAQAIGGVVLARAVLSEDAQQEILGAVRSSGIAMLDQAASAANEP